MKKKGKGTPIKEGKSLRTTLFFAILAPVAGVLILLFLMNSFLLDDFYQSRKKQALLTAFNVVNEASTREKLSEEAFRLRAERLCDRYNLTLAVFNEDGSILFSSSSDEERMQERLFGALFVRGTEDAELDEATDQYVILEQSDQRLSARYLVLWGNLSDGQMVLVRAALEGIEESAAVANRFLLYGALAGIFLGLLASWLFSATISRPVRKLASLSRRMADMDFESNYEPAGRIREIDTLGTDMNALSASLERTISELKTANADLRRDLARREREEEMRRDFLSNVSHELKTPIAVISGYAEGILEGVASDQESVSEYTEIILDESHRMGRLVAELSALNELEYGQTPVEVERIDLFALCEEMIAAQRVLAQPEGITLENSVPRGTFVWADLSLTEQILTNYLSNAIHYAAGPKQVMIDCCPDADRLRLRVFNSGEPVPEEALPHLFEKFYKADKARSRSYGGSGIGLSVVKASAERMGQTCGVENLPDGVRFYVTLDTRSLEEHAQRIADEDAV